MTTIPALNADVSKRVVIDTLSAAWIASPSPGVWRKPLDRAGGETGRATSIVRYDPGTSFPPHEHPEGEEIFVLEGVFSDDIADYPAGTCLMNPPGSRHAPASATGCVILVKLCQYRGAGRRRIVVDSDDLAWRPGDAPGLLVRTLYEERGFPERVMIEKYEPGTRAPHHPHPGGAEFLVLDGVLEDEFGRYPRGTWVRNPAGSAHAPFSHEGATLWVKSGALA